jgi:hypothetical protein
MKKIILMLLFTSSLVSLYAGSGKAIIPHWFKSSTTKWVLRVSNISNSDVMVKVKLINYDSLIYNENSENSANIYAAEGFSENPIDGFVTLSANSTGFVQVNAVGAVKNGFGLIEWQSSDNTNVALIAHGIITYTYNDRYSKAVYPINDFKPF